jgi:Flp pilus assembly protein TadG
MLTSDRARRRRGATVVEFAMVASVLLLLIFAQIVGGLGISRYQELAHLTRSCARYAATHGGNYSREGIAQQTGIPAVASSTDLRNYLTGKTVLLDLNRLQISVSWTAPSGVTPPNMPTYMNTDPNLVPPGQYQDMIQNNVIVTLTYDWFPEAYLIGPITLSSTSQMPMSY